MAYSVSFITNYIGSLLETDMHLKHVEIEGEISNITYHKSGNIYFTLKDENAVISCTIYRSDAYRLAVKPKMGDKVLALGRISVYKQRGSYQLIAKSIKASGEGELYAKYLELKRELGERGMFDNCYKRPIPSFINTLGVVTSPTGAAIRDIINIATRRNPNVSIILYPALVQGDGAADTIANGILKLDTMGVDLIIAGRGGGSIEDLWAFNEEIVANAIFACNTPVISAVGHETDFTIADFVADLRAPTPSAAAELGVYDFYELRSSIRERERIIHHSIERKIENARQKALSARKHLRALSPQNVIVSKRNRAIEIEKRMNISIRSNIDSTRDSLKRAAAGLAALSPAARLSQGYSYVTKDGKNIYKKSDVNIGDSLEIRVTDGEITAQVTEVI